MCNDPLPESVYYIVYLVNIKSHYICHHYYAYIAGVFQIQRSYMPLVGFPNVPTIHYVSCLLLHIYERYVHFVSMG